MKKTLISLIFCAVLTISNSYAALNPYAYGLSSTLSADETKVTISYSLNADATSVDIVILDGEIVLKTVACDGKTTKGSHSVDILTDGFPEGKTLTWKVEVKGAAHNTTNNYGGYRLYHPSGVDVDNNPESPHFGRIICNEAMHAVKSETDTYLSAQFGAGIFEFTPAFEPKPNGSKPGYNGGITFTNLRPDDNSSTAYAPRRVRISEDGRIFVSSLNTDGHVLWEVDPDNLDSWTEVIAGTRKSGDINSVVNGSTYIGGPNVGMDVRGKGTDLQLVMLSGIGTFQCNEYDLGTAKSWNKAPRQILGNEYIVNYTGSNVEYDNEGGIWFCQYRGDASNTQPAFLHINANGEVDYLEGIANVRNGGFRFNPSFTKVITADGRNKSGTYVKGYARIYDVSKDANGKPVLTLWKVIDMSVLGHSLNDFAWDIADNIYVVGHNSEWIRAYALARTADDVATTPCSSAETFSLAAPAQLTPFAYGLESTLSLDETTLTIKYSLNALATSVNWVLLDGNNVVKTVDLTSLGLEKGDYTTTISTTDFPQYKRLTWKIEVKGVAVNKPTHVKAVSFYRPFGVDIDNNPENPHFGRILCGETYTTSNTNYESCGVGAGIYEYSPAFELKPNGTKPGYNGGKTFTEHSPYRIRISEDGRIFVTAHDKAGDFLWEVNPENLNEWTSVFKGTTHNADKLLDASSKFIAGTNAGFDVRGKSENLQLLMLSCNNLGTSTATFQCHEYNLGNATEWSTVPTRSISGTQLHSSMIARYSQVTYDNEGGFWCTYYINTSLLGGIAHFTKDGVKDYELHKIMLRAGACVFNHDFSKLLLCGDISVKTNTPGYAVIYNVSKDANGTPVLTKETTIYTGDVVGGNLNDFAWDYANNIYAIGNNGEKLAVYALPHSSDDVVATPAASKYAFSIGKYTMTVNTNDEDKGTVSGGGEYLEGDVVTLTATAKEGYELLYWSDRSTENPRNITMTKNEALSAYFVKEYVVEPTFTIEKVWENTNVPAATADGYQAVGWDGQVYMQNKTAGQIQVFSNGTDAPTNYAVSNTNGQQIAIDEAGNMIVFNAYFATATPTAIQIYKKGSTTAGAVNFTLPYPGRCDFFSASGDIYSAEGGYVYFYCKDQTAVNRVKITNGATTAADVSIDAIGHTAHVATSVSHVMVDIFGNLAAHNRSTAVYAINAHTGETKSFATTLSGIKLSTLGGCTFELGGKELWAYNVGTTNYSSEWNIYNLTDKKLLSDEVLYAVDKTNSTNNSCNWLNVQVVDENTAYIYQFCPKKAVAVWKVTMHEVVLRDTVNNEELLTDLNGSTTNVSVYRSLTGGMYNTLCLPFNVDNLTGTPLEDATVWQYNGATVKGDGTSKEIFLEFEEVESITAGKPYLVEPAEDIKAPMEFKNVTISVTNGSEIAAHTAVTMHGILHPTELQTNNKSILFLVENNNLAWANVTANMNGMRAYFKVNEPSLLTARTRAYIRREPTVATDMENITTPETEIKKVIYNGSLYIIRGDEVYTIQGTKVK